MRGDSITVCRGRLAASIGLPISPSSRLVIDPSATLFIPKTAHSIWHPMNDIGFFLDVQKERDFLAYPVTRHLGIIIPQSIKSETEDEFVIGSFVIEPIHP